MPRLPLSAQSAVKAGRLESTMGRMEPRAWRRSKMAMSVVYGNAFGGIISENRGGTVSAYVPDPLGSTIGLMNSAGTLTDSWTYWPYGEVRTRSGSNATPFTFLGTLGYFLDTLNKLFYVRARFLRPDLARWLTVDLMWPCQRSQYAYVRDMPVKMRDPSGLAPTYQECQEMYPTGSNELADCCTAAQTENRPLLLMMPSGSISTYTY